MLFLQTHSARLSLVGLLIALLAMLGAFANAWSMTLALLITFIFCIAMTLAILWQHRIGEEQGQQLQRLTTTARQENALLESSDTAWCLFNREGLLLRNNLRQQAILDHGLRHFDDLVALFEDGAPLIEQFRVLQKAGQAFALQLTTANGDQVIRIKGSRSGKYDNECFYVLHFARVERDKPNAPVTQEAHQPSLSETQHWLDSLPFPLWLRDSTLRLTWVNRAYAQWCGIARDDILRQQTELFTPPASGGSARAAIKPGGGQVLAARALQQQIPQQEQGHRVVAEERRLLSYTETPLPDGMPNSPVLLGMAQDITASAELESELRRHIAAHHEVLENLGTPITIYGPDQRLEFFNRAYIRLWDHDEDFLASKPTFGEILEDLRTRRRAPEQVDFQRYKRARMALFTSLIEPREDMMHLPDGTALRIVAVPHPFGGVMFLHEDVTDKLALESSYNTLIAVQRETLDNLAEGIAVFGADGKLKLSNPAYARIWHLAAESLLDEPHVNDVVERMRPLIVPTQWEDFRHTMIACALQREAQHGQCVREDGTIISFNTVPLPDGAMLNSYVDITDSLKVEQALRESNAALATADRLKSEFVANVSYQLRTPLNTIMGFAEILANQYFGTLNERQLEYAKTMMESSKRLKLLIDDVIDLAMVDAGRMQLNRRMIEIAPLLQSVASLMGEWARQQSLELVVDAETGIGSFEVDDKRIKQVLFNLISNAIQYTPPGGHITLQARRVDSMIHLSVLDTGIGIPLHDQDRVWDKFVRSNAHTRQSGVGLGLSLVKSFIALHGGTLQIKSEINHGTQVTCLLPIHAPLVEKKA